MNFASFAPVNYDIKPMELTSATKRMSDVLTLRDMIDKGRMNQLAMDKARADAADAERKRQALETRRRMAEETAIAFNAPQPELVEPQEPVVTEPEVPDVYNIIKSSAATPENLSQGIKNDYGYDIPDSAIAAARSTPLSPDQQGPRVDESVIKSMYESKPIGGYEGEAYEAEKSVAGSQYLSDLEAYKTNKEAQKPENRIPKGQQWKSLDEYQYGLKLAAIDPEAADEWEKNLVDQKYKAMQTSKLQSEIGKEDEAKLLKSQVLKHDRISNMIYDLADDNGNVDPEAIKQRWPGIIRQARNYGISEELLPTEYDPVSAENFLAESKALKGKTKTDPQFQQELKLRGEFHDKSKDYLTVRDAYSAMVGIPDTSAGDLAMIYQFMKALDPRSTVRETEASMAANIGNFDAKVQNMFAQVVSGRKLLPSQRNDMVNTAKSSYGSYERNWKVEKDYYNSLARNYDLDAENITGGYGKPGEYIPSKEEDKTPPSPPGGKGPKKTKIVNGKIVTID